MFEKLLQFIIKRAKVGPDEENQEVVVEHCERSPLLNPVVMDRVFQLIPFNFSDFKNFRLVNKTWYECSLPSWRQTVWVNLGVQRNQPNEPANRGTVESFTDLLKSPGDSYKMLGKNCYRKFNINTLGPDDDDVQLDFWLTVGPLMTHLEISRAEITSRDKLRRVLFEFTPKLQFLALNYNDYTCGPLVENRKLYNKFHHVWDERFRPMDSQIQRNFTHLEICENYNGISKRNITCLPLCYIEVLAHFPNLKVVKLTNQRLDSMPMIDSALGFFLFLHSLAVVKSNCGDHYFSQLKNLRVDRIDKQISSVFGQQELHRMIQESNPFMLLEQQRADD